MGHHGGGVVGAADDPSTTALGGASPSTSASRRQVRPPRPCLRMLCARCDGLVYMLTRAMVAVLAQELASLRLVVFICIPRLTSSIAGGLARAAGND